MDGGGETSEAHHGGEHHVDGFGLHDLIDGMGTGINFDVGLVGEQTG